MTNICSIILFITWSFSFLDAIRISGVPGIIWTIKCNIVLPVQQCLGVRRIKRKIGYLIKIILKYFKQKICIKFLLHLYDMKLFEQRLICNIQATTMKTQILQRLLKFLHILPSYLTLFDATEMYVEMYQYLLQCTLYK